MTTYYRDDRVRVTSTELWLDGVGYPLHRLDSVWHRRGRPDARAISRRGLRLLLIVAALLLVVACAAKTPLLLKIGARAPSLLVRIALVVAGSLASFALLWPLAELVLSGLDHIHLHGVVMHEIWAHYEGRDVLLMRTSDSLRFGRVYRALERAVENQPG